MEGVKYKPMTCATSPTTKFAELSLQAFIEVKNALDECDPDIQAVVSEMLEVYKAPETSPEEKQLAMHTIIDALFPSLGVEALAAERYAASSKEASACNNAMDLQEEHFSDRVRQLMQDKGVSQEQLAVQMGVGQSAVSNMLSRRCRPQQRTIERAAEALGVKPDTLWPPLSAQQVRI